MVKRIYKRKRVVRRRKAKGRRFSTIRRIGRHRLPALGIPDSKLVRLRYGGVYQLADSGLGDGLSALQQFRCNSLFDPDYTGVGHQPRYYDQYAALYDRYVVLGAKIMVSGHMAAASTSNISNGRLTIRLQDRLGVPDDPDSISDLLENTHIRSIAINNQAVGRQSKTLFHKFSAKKSFSITDVKDNHDIAAYYNATPTREAWWTLCVMGAGVGTLSTTYVTVIIDYIALLTHSKGVADS